MMVVSGEPAQRNRLGGLWPEEERAARARGRRSEERALAACRSAARPSWIKTARPAAHDEDQAGIDLVLETDVGRLFVQVKSSMTGKAHFEAVPRKHRIAVVVVREYDSDVRVLEKVSEAVAMLRAEYVRRGRAAVARTRGGIPRR
jgi:hypothetical protein